MDKIHFSITLDENLFNESYITFLSTYSINALTESSFIVYIQKNLKILENNIDGMLNYIISIRILNNKV